MTAGPRPRRATILVQNLPVPLDRRVWSEACALRDAGWRISIVAHRGEGQRWHEELEGIECCRYPAPPQARGALGYALEFGWCWLLSLLWCLRLLATRGIDVLHACNPPDTFFGIALLLRPFGVRFLFDQHDLCPELLRAKLGAAAEGSFFLRAILWLERRTYRAARVVVSPNGSYADIARTRGGKAADSVFVVRSAPPRERFVPASPDPARDARWRRGRRHLIGYIGVMGKQDGVELLLEAAAALVHGDAGGGARDDVGFVLIGDGDEYAALRAQATRLRLDDHVEFTGRVHDLATIGAALGACDVCACPDPKNAFNDLSSMNKIVEYMALGKAVVGFDLRESVRTLAGGGTLVADGRPAALAAGLRELLDDPARREALGQQNRRRFEQELCWEQQIVALRAAYERATA